MSKPSDTTEHDARSDALRSTFPAMPHGRSVLFGALVGAAALDVEGQAIQPDPRDGVAVQRQADSAPPQ